MMFTVLLPSNTQLGAQSLSQIYVGLYIGRIRSKFKLASQGKMYRFVSILYIKIRNDITKTCLYNFDSLKPHFYIVKLGFTGVYIIFLISAQNIDFGYSLEPPRRGGSNEYPQSMF